MQIMDARIVANSPWRQVWQQAQFRAAIFFVDTDNRAGGRRVALHQYPKRNAPYAEDMGRAANRFTVQGYLIGPNYLELKDTLVNALEEDGPGLLRLPMQYLRADTLVMVQAYAVTESRERGGFCSVEMDFVEYGDPQFRSFVSTAGEIMKSAAAAESAIAGPPTATTAQEVAPFAAVHESADLPNDVPPVSGP